MFVNFGVPINRCNNCNAELSGKYCSKCGQHQKNINISIFNLFKEFYGITQGVRRLGAASLDLCFVAMGRFEGFWEFGLQPWDICAGSLIVEEAGGIVTDWDGSSFPFSGTRILASNKHVHNDIISVLNKDLF